MSLIQSRVILIRIIKLRKTLGECGNIPKSKNTINPDLKIIWVKFNIKIQKRSGTYSI